MARIPTMLPRNCVRKLKTLYEEWQVLAKHKDRKSDPGDRRAQFKRKLDKLWDIATDDAIEQIRASRLLKKEERELDVKFYLDQQSERMGCMSGNDKVFAQTLQRNEQRRQVQRKRSRESSAEGPSDPTALLSSSGTDSPSQPSDPDQESDPGPAKKPRLDTDVTLTFPRSIMTAAPILDVADRFRLTSTQITATVAAVLRSAQPPANIDDFSLSMATSRRQRLRRRRKAARSLRASFTPPKHAVVHWDGKMIKDTLGTNEHRLAILVSGGPDHTGGKLLAVPTIADGTGLAQAEATAAALDDWDVADNVVALCYDTTSSNTGRMKGAVVKLEEMLERKLLRLECRHHVLELVMGAVSAALFGPTSGPVDTKFQDLKRRWPQLDTSHMRVLFLEDPWLQELRNMTTEQLQTMLARPSKEQFLRDDYKELAQLVLLVLDLGPSRPRFRRPGACHHARWMAKVLYYIKMYLFAEQLGYNAMEQERLRRVVTFITLIYARAWLTAPLAADAPLSDLQLYRDLQRFQDVDRPVADAALAVLRRHTAYLRPETVVLSLASSAADADQRQALATALLSQPETAEPEDTELCLESRTQLADLVTDASWLVFQLLQLNPRSWLEQPVSAWEEDDEYRTYRDFVRALSVTNDVAERGVAMIESYANTVTRDEAQLQWLLQAVEDHRKRVPAFDKDALGAL